MIEKETDGSHFVPVWIGKRVIQDLSFPEDILRLPPPVRSLLTPVTHTSRSIRIRCNLSINNSTRINIRIKDRMPGQIISFRRPAFLHHRQTLISNLPVEDDHLLFRQLVRQEWYRRENDVIAIAKGKENIWLLPLLPSIENVNVRGNENVDMRCTLRNNRKEKTCVCYTGKGTRKGNETEKGRGREK